jgi:hypothetical protein
MESFRLCWQGRPGGRTECTAPTSRDLAQFRLRDQKTVFPSLRSWIIDETGPATPTGPGGADE